MTEEVLQQRIVEEVEKATTQAQSGNKKSNLKANATGGLSLGGLVVYILLQQNGVLNLGASTNVDSKISEAASAVEAKVMKKVDEQGMTLQRAIEEKTEKLSGKIDEITTAQNKLVIEQVITSQSIARFEEEMKTLNRRLDTRDQDKKMDALIKALNKKLEE